MKALSLTLSILTLATAMQSVNASSPSSSKFFCDMSCNSLFNACVEKATWNKCYAECKPKTIIQCARQAYIYNLMTMEQWKEMHKVDRAWYDNKIDIMRSSRPPSIDD